MPRTKRQQHEKHKSGLARKRISIASQRSTREDIHDDQIDISEDCFEWTEYLQKMSAAGAPEHLFKHVLSDQDAGFEAGMKLEVPNHSVAGTYWVATVIVRCGNLLLLRYEGYQQDNSADFWCNSFARQLHPVGWCSKSGHALRPPLALKEKNIDWYDYLIKNLTGSRTASNSLFDRQPCLINRLRPGMHVEVSDNQDPYRYWVACIQSLYAGRICLQYVGARDAVDDLWLFYTSQRLHVPGWGAANHYRLLPPQCLLQQSSNDSLLAQVNSVEHPSMDRAILERCFKNDELPPPHQFKIGMKMEARRPNEPTCVGAATVTKVFDEDYFLVQIDDLLRYPGDDDDSFVCHVDSPGIFPIGWCQRYGLRLQSPRGFNGIFRWDNYLKYTRCIAAPEDAFPEKNVADHGFQLGMKLECVDQENPSNICVATINQIVGNALWVALDGETRGEQIVDANSADLFPPGWCEAAGHELQWPRPNTIEQKNRISRLRSTTERKSRLSFLRKGRVLNKSPKKNTLNGSDSDSQFASNRDSSKPKYRRSLHYFRGRRRFKRKALSDSDDANDSYTDPSASIVCIQRLAVELNTEENIRASFGVDAEGRVVCDDDNDVEVITLDPIECTTKAADARQTRCLAALGLVSSLDPSLRQKAPFRLPPMLPLPGAISEQRTNTGVPVKKRKLTSIVAMLKKNPRPQVAQQCTLMAHDLKRKRPLVRQPAVPRPIMATDTPLVGSEADGSAVTPLRGSSGGGGSPPCPAHARTKTTMRRAMQSTIAGLAVHAATGRLVAPILLPSGLHGGQYAIVDNIVSTDGLHKIVIKISPTGNLLQQPQRLLLPRTKTNTAQRMDEIKRPHDAAAAADGRRFKSSNPPIGLVDAGKSKAVADENTPCRVCMAHSSMVSPRRCTALRLKRLCAGLPRCAVNWSKQDVTRFMQAANLNKYARTFIEQDIDGRSLLLLTYHELHSLLGITLTHSNRLFDYISQLKVRSQAR